jgi:hypothetical protein
VLAGRLLKTQSIPEITRIKKTPHSSFNALARVSAGLQSQDDRCYLFVSLFVCLFVHCNAIVKRSLALQDDVLDGFTFKERPTSEFAGSGDGW